MLQKVKLPAENAIRRIKRLRGLENQLSHPNFGLLIEFLYIAKVAFL